MTHDQLYDAASDALVQLADDPEVSAERAVASLKSLRAEIDVLLDSQERQSAESDAQERGTAG